MKKLLVFVPTFNRVEKLKVSLGALLSQLDGHESEIAIHVSNNASTDGTGDYLRSIAHPSFSHDENPSNIGISRNILKAFATRDKAEYVWIVGDDDYAIDNAPARLLNAIDQNAGVDIFFVNTLSIPQRFQQEVDIANIASSPVLGRHGIRHSKLRSDFRCTFSDLINPRIDPVFGGALMCYAFRSNKMTDHISPRLVAQDLTQAEACYPHTLNWLYSLKPSSPSMHLHKPFTANVWHDGAEWGIHGVDWAVTHGLGHVLHEAVRLGYVAPADRSAYFRHYIATSRASFNKLFAKYGEGQVPFADAIKNELLTLALGDALSRYGRSIDRRQKLKHLLHRMRKPFSSKALA